MAQNTGIWVPRTKPHKRTQSVNTSRTPAASFSTRNLEGSKCVWSSPKSAGSKDKGQNVASASLSLNWQDAHPFIRDDARNYGGEQTAVSEETVLASLATIVKSQRIKTLGILATDPLDTAFLIHSFRKSSPDVRLSCGSRLALSPDSGYWFDEWDYGYQ